MKQHTNKILLGILFVLLSAFVLTKVFRTPARESNLNTDLFSIDTGKISAVKFYLAGNAKDELTLKKNDSVWTVQKDEMTAKVESHELQNLLRTLSEIRPERIVSRKKEKWDDYQVGDTSAIQMVAYNAGMKELANWYIGKESQGSTYIRHAEEDVVYAMEGSLRNTFDKNFDAWRDKTFLRMSKAFINKITFEYPADSGFVLERKQNLWMMNNQAADSTAVENYLEQLRSKDLSDFANDFSPSRDPDVTLRIEGSMPQVVVRAWRDAGTWMLGSSHQEGVYFLDTNSFTKELFPGKGYFRAADH